MKYFVNGCAFVSILTAAIAAVSFYALAEGAAVTTTATVIEPVKVNESIKILTTGSFVSGVTGDLVMRIATTINVALENEGLNIRKEPEAGLLDGNPVNSINIVTIDGAAIDMAAADVSAISNTQASSASVNIVIAYN